MILIDLSGKKDTVQFAFSCKFLKLINDNLIPKFKYPKEDFLMFLCQLSVLIFYPVNFRYFSA